MKTLYPRVSNGLAEQTLKELRAEPGAAHEFVALEHPKAVPAATGGRRAELEELRQLRTAVLARLESIGDDDQRGFDRVLGQALSENLDISASDAAHKETWNFLTLMVFPDLLVRRFPDLHRDRALGGQRNVLRRVWLRERIIGKDGYSTERPLSEDEYVQILERSATARIPGLSRILGATIAGLTVVNREDFTRTLMRRVSRLTGPLELALYDEHQLRATVLNLVHDIARGWPSTVLGLPKLEN